MGLECHNPTPLGDTKERLIFDGGEGKIVNGTEAGINWPFIVRLVKPYKRVKNHFISYNVICISLHTIKFIASSKFKFYHTFNETYGVLLHS